MIQVEDIKQALSVVNSVAVSGDHSAYILMTIKKGRGKFQLFPGKYAESSFSTTYPDDLSFYVERALLTPWLLATEKGQIEIEYQQGGGRVAENTNGLMLKTGRRKLFLSEPSDPMKITKPKSDDEEELGAAYTDELIRLFPSLSRSVLDASTNPTFGCIFASGNYIFLRGPNFFARIKTAHKGPQYPFPLELAPHIGANTKISISKNYCSLRMPAGYVYVPLDANTWQFPKEPIEEAMRKLKCDAVATFEAGVMNDLLGRMCTFMSSEKMPARIVLTGKSGKNVLKAVSKVANERVIFEETIKTKKALDSDFKIAFYARELSEVLSTLPTDNEIGVGIKPGFTETYWTSEGYSLAVSTVSAA